MRRDWSVLLLAVPSVGVAGALLAFVDFADEPRQETIGGDVVVTREGCLDWWCRAEDVVPVVLAAFLLIAALAALAWGMRRRH